MIMVAWDLKWPHFPANNSKSNRDGLAAAGRRVPARPRTAHGHGNNVVTSDEDAILNTDIKQENKRGVQSPQT